MENEKLDSPVDPFIGQVLKLGNFISVSREGFDWAKMMEVMTDMNRSFAVQGFPKDNPYADDAFYNSTKKRAQELGEFARGEQRDGHRFLFGLVIVRLYSVVEAAAHATFVAALARGLDADTSEKLLGAKGELVPFLRATDTERCEILRDRLMEDTKARHKPGLGRFETLFCAIAVPASTIPSIVFQTFLEFSETRHVIVHRNGLVDAKFLKCCPWINAVIGSDVPYSAQSYLRYSQAALWYLLDLDRRWKGVTASQEHAEMMEGLISRLNSNPPVPEPKA